MDEERCGYLTTVEITQAIEYLRTVGLTGAQIYGFWAYVATGVLIPEATCNEK